MLCDLRRRWSIIEQVVALVRRVSFEVSLGQDLILSKLSLLPHAENSIPLIVVRVVRRCSDEFASYFQVSLRRFDYLCFFGHPRYVSVIIRAAACKVAIRQYKIRRRDDSLISCNSVLFVVFSIVA